MLRKILPIAVVAGVVLAPEAARAEEKFSLKSVSVDLPTSDRTFPNGPGSDATNNNCLICHSAGMVLSQPGLSKAAWQAEVNKMRTAYEAAIDPKDVDAIADYLVSIRGPNSTTAGEQSTSHHGDLNHAIENGDCRSNSSSGRRVVVIHDRFQRLDSVRGVLFGGSFDVYVPIWLRASPLLLPDLALGALWGLLCSLA